MPFFIRKVTVLVVLPFMLGAGAQASDNPVLDTLMQNYAAEAGVSGFSAADGEALFQATHSGGKPDSPSCTSCHTSDPKAMGMTRAGKPIEPMAVSTNPKRFTDPAFVEKWFGRNCNTVLGRDCSAQEKGDVLAYLSAL
jgi:hypothetical protein